MSKWARAAPARVRAVPEQAAARPGERLARFGIPFRPARALARHKLTRLYHRIGALPGTSQPAFVTCRSWLADWKRCHRDEVGGFPTVSCRGHLGGPRRALVAGIGCNRDRWNRYRPHLRHHRTRSSGQETSVSPQEADCTGGRRERRSESARRKRVTRVRRQDERLRGGIHSDRRKPAGH